MSAYLRMVEQGERVAVIHRGRIVAELGPPAHTSEEDAYAELRRRARAGTVRLSAPNRPDLYPRPSRRLPSRVVQDLLGEVRGDSTPSISRRRWRFGISRRTWRCCRWTIGFATTPCLSGSRWRRQPTGNRGEASREMGR